MPKNQNTFAKRQREMDKKQKAERKRQRRKLNKSAEPVANNNDRTLSPEPAIGPDIHAS
jgi:hypothetical protein